MAKSAVAPSIAMSNVITSNNVNDTTQHMTPLTSERRKYTFSYSSCCSHKSSITVLLVTSPDVLKPSKEGITENERHSGVDLDDLTTWGWGR